MDANQKSIESIFRLLSGTEDVARELGLEPQKGQTREDLLYELLRDRLASMARDKLLQLGVEPKVATTQVKNIFSNSMMRQYAPGVFQYYATDERIKKLHAEQVQGRPVSDEESCVADKARKQKLESNDNIAAKYGLDNGASISRQRNQLVNFVFSTQSESNDPDKPLPLPSLKTIAHMNAAFNVEIDSGAVIAKRAYTEALAHFQSILAEDSSLTVNEDQVFAAYIALKTRSFWLAACEKEETLRTELVQEVETTINRTFREYEIDATFTYPEIVNSVDAVRDLWPFVWSTLPDGWFR